MCLEEIILELKLIFKNIFCSFMFLSSSEESSNKGYDEFFNALS